MSSSKETKLKSAKSFFSRTSLPVAATLLLFLGSTGIAPAQRDVIRIDASQSFTEPIPTQYTPGFATSPSGKTLGVNSRYLTRDGSPWLPVMGEFHFSRFPESKWEEEILKMKASGVNIIAAYLIWIHHEEVQGHFDWEGQRNLRKFAELCARHGMFLEPRIGPWAHAEARNGGLPDWVIAQGPTRTNDPAYLAAVHAWYGQVALQLKGLLWKDGGPVIGIQLENEYSRRGPGAGEEHILELKRIAIESGLDVPLYFVTGWDNAVIPRAQVLPVYGGYPDAPWDESTAKLPPAEVYAFRFQNRVSANMGAIGAPAQGAASSPEPESTPYMTAEMGGGIQDTYHRRPVILPNDIAAMVPVMIGSGVNLYGSYMFQGGENPDGKLTTLQESQETGYPNDVPIKSYDFQAPLGEFGQERESFRKLKVFQYFLNDFGSTLAPMIVHAPAVLPKNTTDLSVPRVSVRSKGDAGFIFFNNHVRGYSMPARPATQFELALPGGSLRVPQSPVTIPADAYFIWPFNLRTGDITLRYSTAQLFTRIDFSGVTTLYFEAIPGIPSEFAFDAREVRSAQASSGSKFTRAGTLHISGITPGIQSSIEIVSTQGKTLRLVLLSAAEAENAWKIKIAGNELLLLTSQDFFSDPDAASPGIELLSRNSPNFAFSIIPPAAAPIPASLPLRQTASSAKFQSFTATATAKDPQLAYHQLAKFGLAPPVKLGSNPEFSSRHVAQAPPAEPLTQAAKWSISIPPGALDGLNDLYLQVNYQGDLARLYEGQRLLADDFYNGLPWSVGLGRFLQPVGGGSFELSVLPLRKDAPIYLENRGDLNFSPNGQAGVLNSLTLIPEYKLTLGGADH